MVVFGVNYLCFAGLNVGSSGVLASLRSSDNSIQYHVKRLSEYRLKVLLLLYLIGCGLEVEAGGLFEVEEEIHVVYCLTATSLEQIIDA